MIEAANVHPNYLLRQKLVAEDLRKLQEPCVIFEHEWTDTDGERCFAYTVGGWLNGRPVGGIEGGATVGGEVIVIHATNRQEADYIASLGLQDTIRSLDGEEAAYIEANAALARLGSVGAVRRLELSTAKPADMSDEFVKDQAQITKLRGDDIVLTVGGVTQ